METQKILRYILGMVVLLTALSTTQGQIKRCYSCRSRGKLGDCKDPIRFNSTNLLPGVEAVPCASGWCSKSIDGKKDGKDHDLATERQCLQRAPPDGNERCAEALVGHKKIFICFCYGDLCNSACEWKLSPVLLFLPLVTQLLHRT